MHLLSLESKILRTFEERYIITMNSFLKLFACMAIAFGILLVAYIFVSYYCLMFLFYFSINFKLNSSNNFFDVSHIIFVLSVEKSIFF